MYQSRIKNAKINDFTRKVDDSLIIVENDKFRYQHQTILTLLRLKIHNMKTDKKIFIYEHIQRVNKVDEECKYFRRAICKKKQFFNQILLNQCFIENELFFYQKQL